MKQILLINDDYLGHVDHVRHCGRGIVIKDGKVLLSYLSNNGYYMIPGGGVEEGESYAACCERELLEETGIVVRAKEEVIEIEELFDVWRHFSHFFICEFVRDTGETHFTEAEEEAGYEKVWISLEEAVNIFGKYEEYRMKDIPLYGLYRREFTALTEVMNGKAEHLR